MILTALRKKDTGYILRTHYTEYSNLANVGIGSFVAKRNGYRQQTHALDA